MPEEDLSPSKEMELKRGKYEDKSEHETRNLKQTNTDARLKNIKEDCKRTTTTTTTTHRPYLGSPKSSKVNSQHYSNCAETSCRSTMSFSLSSLLPQIPLTRKGTALDHFSSLG